MEPKLNLYGPLHREEWTSPKPAGVHPPIAHRSKEQQREVKETRTIGGVPLDIGRTVETAIQGAINATLGKVFTGDNLRDAGVYLGAGLLLLVAVWATLR